MESIEQEAPDVLRLPAMFCWVAELIGQIVKGVSLKIGQAGGQLEIAPLLADFTEKTIPSRIQGNISSVLIGDPSSVAILCQYIDTVYTYFYPIIRSDQ